MKASTQQQVNMALMAINYLSNNLNVVNTEMGLIPSIGMIADAMQKDRVKQHKDFADRIIELANDMGDYFNDLDVMEEDDLAVINPLFEFINENAG